MLSAWSVCGGNAQLPPHQSFTCVCKIVCINFVFFINFFIVSNRAAVSSSEIVLDVLHRGVETLQTAKTNTFVPWCLNILIHNTSQMAGLCSHIKYFVQN